MTGMFHSTPDPVQMELPLAAGSTVRPQVERFPVAFFWKAEQNQTVKGLAVMAEELVLELRWSRPVLHLHAGDGLIGSIREDHAPLPQVFMNDVFIGAASLVELVAWCVGAAKPEHLTLDFSTCLLAVRPQLDKSISRSLQQRLAFTLGGHRLPKMLMAASQQGLLCDDWQDWDWRAAVDALNERAARGEEDGDDFAVLAARSHRHLPSRSLANRIRGASIVRPYLIAASGLQPEEKNLLDENLARLLRSAYKRWIGTQQMPSKELLCATCAFILKLAQRKTYVQGVRLGRYKGPSTAKLQGLGFAGCIEPLDHHSLACADSEVRTALIWSWLSRCEREFSTPLPASIDALRQLEDDFDELVELIPYCRFTAEEVRRLPWADLFAAAPEMRADRFLIQADLPDTAWPCPMPSMASQSHSGLCINPITSTEQLKAEARDQRNCLANSSAYLTQLIQGQTCIFSITGEEIRATLQISKTAAGCWCVQEVKGVFNADLADDLENSPARSWSAVRDFVDAFVRFKQSEMAP